jgi:hypothetical protein
MVQGTASSVTVEGLIVDVNQVILSFQYMPSRNSVVADMLTVTAKDVLTGVTTKLEIRISIKPVNDAPSVTMSGYDASSPLGPAAVMTMEDTPAHIPPMIVTDADVKEAPGSTLEVTLTVSDKGTISFKSEEFATGIRLLSVEMSDMKSIRSNKSGVLSFVGSISRINKALSGMQYTPPPEYHGNASLVVTVDDKGNTGEPDERIMASNSILSQSLCSL